MAQTAKAAPKKAGAKAAAKRAAAPKKAAVIQEAPPTIPVPPPPPPVTPAPASDGRRLVVPIIAAVLVVLALALLLQLGAQERGGPPHTGVYMAKGVPGTLYLPGKLQDDLLPDTKPVGQRPPLIVMGHGYSSDQQGLSIMARSLARSGYATLTFDFRGHGYNRNHFEGDLREDVDAVLDWAETSPYVDPKKIAVLGHSMGAGVGLEVATLDPRVTAVIPISGGDIVNDANTPKNALFILAEGDPGDLKDSVERSVPKLQGRPGTSVKLVEISDTDHLSVVRDGRTIKAIDEFMVGAFGVPADRQSTGRDDPRVGTAFLYLLVAVALTGFLGRAVGRLVTPMPSTGTGGAWILLVGALLLTMPLMATGGPTFLPIGAGQQVAVSIALAAAALWAVRLGAQRGLISGRITTWLGDGPWLPLRSIIWPGVAAGAVLFLMFSPAGNVLHNGIPNVERLVYWVVLAALMLPFFAAFEAIVRRGSTWRAVGFGVLGRVVLMAGLVIGLAVGAVPGVLGLVLIPLALQYFVLEIFAGACYAVGRNTAVIAVVDAIFVAWVAVMFTPIG